MPRQEHTPPQPKFWRYEVAPGWFTLAGKTDEDNDLLSTTLAKPTDYWFHVSGVPGSHVILQGPEGEIPEKSVIEAAAAVAAWHSKGRNAPNCKVDCTLARYVTKPRNVPAGTVTISHNKIIKVKPGVPAQQA